MDIDVKKYITRALEDTNFQVHKITIIGSSEKADGYASDMTYATVLVTEEGVEKTVEVAVKSGKRSFLETKETRNLYKREAYFYKTIFPEFIRFQKQNNIKHVFNSVAKCYKTISDEDMEVIVMENLKNSGYDLYDRKKPLDLDHLKLVLREYGKFHATSFAMREKSRESFEKLISNLEDTTLNSFSESFRKIFQQGLERVCDILKIMGHKKLYEMFNKILQKGADVAWIEILETVEPLSAILHGDCWNNNFLYKYEEKSHRIPSKVAILDWQISRFHSPVLDLSYFIYCMSSEEQLRHFDELLDAYYSSFSAHLRAFGCDPEKLFPFTTLQKHWKKYALQGVLLTTSFLHVMICDKEEAPELAVKEDMDERVMNVKITDEAGYRERLIAVINHYCNYIQEYYCQF